MDMLKQMLELMSTFVIVAGGVWTVWGIISFALALNDHNGSGIRSGLLQVVGGGLVIAAAALLKTLA
jgi:uncharacterized membrane protein